MWYFIEGNELFVFPSVRSECRITLKRVVNTEVADYKSVFWFMKQVVCNITELALAVHLRASMSYNKGVQVQVCTHPPTHLLSPFSCLSLRVVNELCKASSWRMLNHQSFYFHPEYKWVSSGFIPSSFLSSVSHLPLSVSTSSTTAKH